MIEKRNTGLTGARGGIKSLGQLTQIIRTTFAPSSTQQPPISVPGTVLRQATRPAQTYITKLVAGGAAWAFSQPYAAKPSVQVTAEGAPSAGTPVFYTVFAQNPAQQYTAVQVHSTLNTDTRIVHITATGNPN